MKSLPLFEGRGIDAYNKMPTGDFNGILPKTKIWGVYVFLDKEGEKIKSMSRKDQPDTLTNLINLIIGSIRTSPGSGTDFWIAGVFTSYDEAKKLYDALDMEEDK